MTIQSGTGLFGDCPLQVELVEVREAASLGTGG
jgi:hypothetical protein